MKHTLPLALVLLSGLHVSSVLAAEPDISAGTDNPAVHLQLIQRMQQQGAWFASLAHIDALRQQHGDSPALQLAQADALRQTGQIDEAKKLYVQLLRGPHQAAALNGLGLVEAQQGHLPQAIDKLRQASRLTPLNVGYLGDLGFALLLSGDHQAARLPLAQAVELAPGDGRSVANAALWHLLAGNTAEAEAMFERARLPAASRQQVHATAERLRRQQSNAQTQVAEVNATASVRPDPSPTAAVPEQGRGRPAAAAPPSVESAQPFLPRAPMLEHFATTSPQQGSQP